MGSTPAGGTNKKGTRMFIDPSTDKTALDETKTKVMELFNAQTTIEAIAEQVNLTVLQVQKIINDQG